MSAAVLVKRYKAADGATRWQYYTEQEHLFASGFATKAEATQAAHAALDQVVFEAEVEAYDGPMVSKHLTAECVDCHEQVEIRATLYGTGSFCPQNLSRYGTGHRVSRADADRWERIRRIIAAKAAAIYKENRTP